MHFNHIFPFLFNYLEFHKSDIFPIHNSYSWRIWQPFVIYAYSTYLPESNFGELLVCRKGSLPYCDQLLKFTVVYIGELIGLLDYIATRLIFGVFAEKPHGIFSGHAAYISYGKY